MSDSLVRRYNGSFWLAVFQMRRHMMLRLIRRGAPPCPFFLSATLPLSKPIRATCPFIYIHMYQWVGEDYWVAKGVSVTQTRQQTQESETVDLHIWLIRRKKYVTIHGRLHQAWDDYEEEKLTTTELLRIISHINALGPSTAVHHMLDDDES
ncbi:hypothetical protein DPMN_111483 [Dreissena polymorpha]|uniref:Uncharacterized protein n=1 Tax=Dreissena polymorpha TaxID=45954 RepID=A0A9D4KEZ6_DREPO|nr:hypothetical protein DPMN_111483 [Dreissena polymorpha]